MSTKTDESLFVELGRLSSVLSKAAPKSAQTIAHALAELRRLNLAPVQLTPGPAQPRAALPPHVTPTTPEPAPDLQPNTDAEGYAEGPEQPDTPPATDPPPQPAKFYALRWMSPGPNHGKFMEPFQYCDWDSIHRVASPGFPAVWNEQTAKALSQTFNSLGAQFDVVDTAEVAPKGVRRA